MPKPSSSLLVALVVLSWLSACTAKANLFDLGTGDHAREAAGLCPQLIPYSQAELAEAGQAVEALPDGHILLRFMDGYALLRDQVRICWGAVVY